jgi:hydrogenase maturation protease
MNKIVCAGNRFSPEDCFGPLVYDRLMLQTTPPGVEIIDGGLAGIDLLPHFENSDRVVVVDRIHGFGQPGELLKVVWDEIAQSKAVAYGHSAGLQYLLLCLPALGIIPQVEVILIGLDGPADGAVISSAARMALEAADG